MSAHSSPEAAYGHAHATLTELLRAAGSAHPHDQARDYLQELQRDGWSWRRREVPPPRPREGVPAAACETYQQARDRLAAELAAVNAAYAAREGLPPHPDRDQPERAANHQEEA